MPPDFIGGVLCFRAMALDRKVEESLDKSQDGNALCASALMSSKSFGNILTSTAKSDEFGKV